MPVAVDLDLVAVLTDQDVLGSESHRVRQLGVMDHVAVLAVHRDEVLRSQQLVERAQLALASVTRGVDRLVARSG